MSDKFYCLYHNNRFIGTYENIQDGAHLDHLVTTIADCYGYLKSLMVAVEYDRETYLQFIAKDDPGDDFRLVYRDLKIVLMARKPVLNIRDGQTVLDYEYEDAEELTGKEHVFSV